MDVKLIQQIVDELFALLESKVAGRPVLLIVLHSLQAVANSLIPELVGNLAVKGIK